MAHYIRVRCVSASLPFHLRMGTDPVSEMCCFKILDYGQSLQTT